MIVRHANRSQQQTTRKPWDHDQVQVVIEIEHDRLGPSPDALEGSSGQLPADRASGYGAENIGVEHFDTRDDSAHQAGVEIAGECLGFR